jgi:hypothetical protein
VAYVRRLKKTHFLENLHANIECLDVHTIFIYESFDILKCIYKQWVHRRVELDFGQGARSLRTYLVALMLKPGPMENKLG